MSKFNKERCKVMENFEIIMQYSPVITLVLVYFIQMKIFVTPAELEKKHREILTEAENRFAPSITVFDLKEQICDIKEKIDKIYNLFLTNNQ